MARPDSKPVLVAPLDWGLGHAARCIPIIERLLNRGHTVHLAGSDASLRLLTDKYPDLPAHELPGYQIHYPVDKNASVQILLQTPRMFRTIRREQEMTESIVSQHGIGIILSDNRYGIRSRHCRNILLCHQLALQAPAGFGWTNAFFLKGHFRMMRPFDELWIPDMPGNVNLAGKLAHGFSIPMPHRFIGPLSRFAASKPVALPAPGQYRIVVLLSGNEPQRTHFENRLTEQLLALNEPVLLIQGMTDAKRRQHLGKLDIVSFLQADELFPYLQAAEVVICRSGYSTLMDMAALGKRTLLVPTPGQTEQEYLADELQQKGMAVMQAQDKLDLAAGLEAARSCRGLHALTDNESLLEAALDTLG